MWGRAEGRAEKWLPWGRPGREDWRGLPPSCSVPLGAPKPLAREGWLHRLCGWNPSPLARSWAGSFSCCGSFCSTSLDPWAQEFPAGWRQPRLWPSPSDLQGAWGRAGQVRRCRASGTRRRPSSLFKSVDGGLLPIHHSGGKPRESSFTLRVDRKVGEKWVLFLVQLLTLLAQCLGLDTWPHWHSTASSIKWE